MLAAGPATKITIHLNEDTSSHHDFLYNEIFSFLREHGVAGATLIRASVVAMGRWPMRGRTSRRIQTAKFFSLSRKRSMGVSIAHSRHSSSQSSNFISAPSLLPGAPAGEPEIRRRGKRSVRLVVVRGGRQLPSISLTIRPGRYGLSSTPQT